MTRWPIFVNTPYLGSVDDYISLKEHLAQCSHRKCVYCGITENRSGGIYYMHVEHYRPKKKFPQLKSTIGNLFIACAICNTFKGDDWPREPDGFSVPAYPDPSRHNFNELFVVRGDGRLESPLPAGVYMIYRLNLNRVQLVLDRRTEGLVERLKAGRDYAESCIRAAGEHMTGDLAGRYFRLVCRSLDWLLQEREVLLYSVGETRR